MLLLSVNADTQEAARKVQMDHCGCVGGWVCRFRTWKNVRCHQGPHRRSKQGGLWGDPEGCLWGELGCPDLAVAAS